MEEWIFHFLFLCVCYKFVCVISVEIAEHFILKKEKREPEKMVLRLLSVPTLKLRG